MKHKIFSFVGVMILVLSMTVMPGWQGQAVASGPAVVSHIVSAADLKAGAALWTRDAMVNAKPWPLPLLKGTPAGMKPSLKNTGVAGSTAAGSAAFNADSIAQAAFAADWKSAPEAALSPDITPAGASGTFSMYVINSWAPAQTIYPHKWVGRLYLSGTPGSGYCSGTAISGNVMVTAAHCVYDLGAHSFFNYWAFTPAYKNGSAPYGTFTANTCWVLNSWIAQPYYSFAAVPYDVAVCTMGTNAAGQTLNAAVGYMGRSWNYGYVLNLFVMGYPWQDTSGNTLAGAGYYLRTCTAETNIYATDVLRAGCGWGPGISGGPWVKGYQQNIVAGSVDSVVSGYVSGVPNLYGARFTSNNIVPLCNAAGC